MASVPNTFKESKESFFAIFKTKYGWISFILSNLIYGYLILSYIGEIKNFILGKISSIPSFLVNPVSWVLFGIFSSLIGFAILLIVEKIVELSGIKNRRTL
jgi:hypothetical protein